MQIKTKEGMSHVFIKLNQLFAEDEHVGKLFKEQNGVHMKSNDKKH